MTLQPDTASTNNKHPDSETIFLTASGPTYSRCAYMVESMPCIMAIIGSWQSDSLLPCTT